MIEQVAIELEELDLSKNSLDSTLDNVNQEQIQEGEQKAYPLRRQAV